MSAPTYSTPQDDCNAIAADMAAFAQRMSVAVVTLREHGIKRPNLDDLAECVNAWREDVLDAGREADAARNAPDPDYARKTREVV